MEQLYFKILRTPEESVLVEEWRLPYFYSRVHFHPEYQITAINNSTGSLFIGDKLESFQPGDVFLIGANVPHVFISNEDGGPQDNSLSAVSIYFSKDSFGENFFNLPELKQANDMLQKAEFGVKLEGSCKQKVSELLMPIGKLSRFDRLITILTALQTIATSSEVTLISSSSVPLVFERGDESSKIDQVYEYTLKNYMRKIKLKEVADLMSMTPTSFCKYFKVHTQKTYVEFLIGVRVSNACRQLVNSRRNISEIAYACGFTNLSNFTRQFKSLIGLSPREYRKTMHKQYREGAGDSSVKLPELK